MFLTYPSPEAATNALRALDQLLFGKNRLYVNRFGEIERFASMAIEEDSTPRNWPQDSEPAEKVSCRHIGRQEVRADGLSVGTPPIMARRPARPGPVRHVP
jgi:hypothetical protein